MTLTASAGDERDAPKSRVEPRTAESEASRPKLEQVLFDLEPALRPDQHSEGVLDAFELADVGLCLADSNGRALFVSARFASRVGRNARDLVSRQLEELTHLADPESRSGAAAADVSLIRWRTGSNRSVLTPAFRIRREASSAEWLLVTFPDEAVTALPGQEALGWLSELGARFTQLGLAIQRLNATRTAGMSPAQAEERLSPLTPRQFDVARRLLENQSMRQIAGELGVTLQTVRGHVKAIYVKYGVHSRVEFVRRVNERA